MKKLFVLDAFNFLFRSYYAIGPMTNAKGESTGALYGFIRSVLKIINEENAQHLVAVFDGPDNTKSRKKLYNAYKIHRKGMPEDLYSQLEHALYFCDIAGIPLLSISGVEADDVMGSLVQQNEKRGITTLLCSSDKDLCQLISGRTFILNIHKDYSLLDRDGVKEKFGVYPEQMVDFLSMVGDPSDNIPGLAGIGTKTAAALLSRYGSLQQIYAHCDELKGKQSTIFAQGRDVVELSKQLATIQTDVDVPLDHAFFRLHKPDVPKMQAFYQKMHFMTLLREIQLSEKEERQPDLDLGVDPQAVAYTLVDDLQKLKALLHRLRSASSLCVDTETTGVNPMQSELVGIGIGDDVARSWYIPLNGKIGRRQIRALMGPFFIDKERAFFGHNIKYDLHVLEEAGMPVGRIDFDTMIASYLLAPHQQRHNLDILALQHFAKVKTPLHDLIGKGKGQITMADVPLDQAAAYCCEDVDYTFRLRKIFEPQLQQEGLYSLLTETEIPLVLVLCGMEKLGIYLDIKPMEAMQVAIEKRLQAISMEIFDLAEERFNLNSPKQLGVILFEKMGVRLAKKTATGYSTSAGALEPLKDQHPIVAKIIEYRGMEKLRSTYINALPQQINPQTGRIHCSFHQTATATGRLSCTEPNLQNIPIRTEEGRRIRTAFRPQKTGHSFLTADYSQIELRLLAHLSEDPALVKAFNRGEDIHAYTASLVYQVPLDDVTPQMRHAAKAVNFGIVYGQSPFGLSKEIGVSKQEAQAFIETYFTRYRKVRDYLEFCKEMVRQKGYSLTLLGRRRPIPEINSKNAFIRQAAERLSINTPLQGSAADLIKMAMIAIDAQLKGSPAAMLLQIHDELLFEAPDEQLELLERIVRLHMEGVVQLKIPLTVDILIGKNWGECYL